MAYPKPLETVEFFDKFRSLAIKLLNEKQEDVTNQLKDTQSKISELLEDVLLIANYNNDKEHALKTVAKKVDEQLQLDKTSKERVNTKLNEADDVLDELNKKWPHSALDTDILKAKEQVASWKE